MSLRILLFLPAFLFLADLVLKPHVGLQDYSIPILKLSSSLHIFFPIVNILFLGILTGGQKRFVARLIGFVFVVNLANYFFHLPVTILLMTTLGWVHFLWNYYHFGTQAQGVFKFVSFDEAPARFRRFESWVIGVTYFVLIPYAVVADNARLQDMFLFRFSQTGHHVLLISCLTALLLASYFGYARHCGLALGRYRLLAATYLLAPPLIALTNSLSIRFFLYLLPHQLAEIYFQLKISRGIIAESLRPAVTSLRLGGALLAGVTALYLTYSYPQIRAALSGGPVSWASYKHSSALFHWGSALFVSSAFCHFYADGIMYKFRNPMIRERVLPYLLGQRHSS